MQACLRDATPAIISDIVLRLTTLEMSQKKCTEDFCWKTVMAAYSDYSRISQPFQLCGLGGGEKQHSAGKGIAANKHTCSPAADTRGNAYVHKLTRRFRSPIPNGSWPVTVTRGYMLFRNFGWHYR